MILRAVAEKGTFFPFRSTNDWYVYCEPVSPEDDIIYKPSALTDEGLRNMIKDPKYWKDNDPETVRKVEEGFKKLYQKD